MLMITEEATKANPKPRRMSPEEVRVIEEQRLEKWIGEQVAASKAEPITECVTLSPALATVLLKRNPGNRPISQVGLDRIKRDIEGGRWVFNGEAIVVSRDGLLNDGQHRCRAVIETGRSIRMVIVFGPDRESRLTLDQGVTRTVGHYLAMHGHTDANNLATAATYLWQYRNKGRLSTAGEERPTKTETRHVAEDNKQLAASLSFVSRPGVNSVCTRSMLTFVHFAIAERAGEEAADAFMDKLIKGAGLVEGDPILYCRNRLIETRSRARIQERAELLFKTWNAHRLGEKTDRINVAGKKLPKLER